MQTLGVRQRTAQSNANIVGVHASVAEDLNLSISRRSQQIKLSQTTMGDEFRGGIWTCKLFSVQN